MFAVAYVLYVLQSANKSCPSRSTCTWGILVHYWLYVQKKLTVKEERA